MSLHVARNGRLATGTIYPSALDGILPSIPHGVWVQFLCLMVEILGIQECWMGVGRRSPHSKVPQFVLAPWRDWEILVGGSQVVIAEFWAEWCLPCKRISPIFAEYEERFPQLRFVRVDFDEHDEIAHEAKIKEMPIFIAYKDGKLIDSVVGVVPQKLEYLLKDVS
ncbi:thioredoxin [Cryptococcus depauperatus CBS 7841]|uniref:Thioredoxin n=1 Tax=Cryptococcus depauperatus CBS 7841 TaxID=1295531 RepID=A0AAJ8M487_9TREE